MTDRARAAFIVAHGRQELLNQTVAAIKPQVDRVLVIDNASNPRLTADDDVTLLYLPDQPPNLAKWWNLGLDFYASWYRDQPYDVAILCDDAIVPDGWFNAIVTAMDGEGAIAGSASPWGHPFPPIVKRAADHDIMNRLCSWAFVVNWRSPVRADESMHWWFFDTDFDFQLRHTGGTVFIGTHPVVNTQYNHYTNVKPELAEQAGRDRAAFAAKHGGTPW